MGSAHRAKRLAAAFTLAGMSVLGMAAASDSGAQQSDDVYVTPSSTVVSPPSTTPRPTPPEVLGNSAERSDAAPAPAVASTQADNGPKVLGTSLAFTGQNTMIFLGLGVAAVAVGGFILTLRRRALPSD